MKFYTFKLNELLNTVFKGKKKPAVIFFKLFITAFVSVVFKVNSVSLGVLFPAFLPPI